jgi:hypothetical protein
MRKAAPTGCQPPASSTNSELQWESSLAPAVKIRNPGDCALIDASGVPTGTPGTAARQCLDGTDETVMESDRSAAQGFSPAPYCAYGTSRRWALAIK